MPLTGCQNCWQTCLCSLCLWLLCCGLACNSVPCEDGGVKHFVMLLGWLRVGWGGT